MATNEKPLYKNITISSPTSENPVTSKQYRGISTVANPRGFNLYDLEIIKQDIINHFHIRKGEKLENPMFGTIIWDITEVINYDPRISVETVTVDAYESGLQVDCTLTYIPYSISESMRIKFDQNNGLL